MLTYKRYQDLHAIHIHVPGEPGNEAIAVCCNLVHVSYPDPPSTFQGGSGNETNLVPASALVQIVFWLI